MIAARRPLRRSQLDSTVCFFFEAFVGPAEVEQCLEKWLVFFSFFLIFFFSGITLFSWQLLGATGTATMTGVAMSGRRRRSPTTAPLRARAALPPPRLSPAPDPLPTLGQAQTLPPLRYLPLTPHFLRHQEVAMLITLRRRDARMT